MSHHTENCRAAGSWKIFLLSSVVPFVGGLLLVLLCRVFRSVYGYAKRKTARHRLAHINSDTPEVPSTLHKRQKSSDRCWVTSFACIVRFAEDLSYPKSRRGRIMTWLTMFFTVVATVLYLIDTAKSLERCIERTNVTVVLDFICNVFFLCRFTAMFISAEDKLSFWVEPNSLIDFCTVPPAFLTIYLGTTWLGLRFTRAVRLNWFGEDIAAVRLASRPQLFLAEEGRPPGGTTSDNIWQAAKKFLSSRNILNLSKRLCQFVSFWLTAGGLYFLVDNMTVQNADRHNCTDSHCGFTFWESLYFLFITLTTIGYGDKSPDSRATQIVVLLIIIVGLAVFASFGPAVVELFSKQPSYLGDYDDRKSSHVIVCGYITTSTVGNFMREFLHPENENQETTAVFLNPTAPTKELQKLMNRQFNYRCEYFQGNPLNSEDLQRVKCGTAKACLVIAKKHSLEPDEEDGANILRVISIKNFRASVRVIIQILSYHNEEHLFNVPGWSYLDHGDEVLCVNEIKLGLLGKSCLCPGFSTMMANLIRMSSHQHDHFDDQEDEETDWKYEYRKGAANELYTGKMSRHFVGMSFPAAAEICLRELGILLIGVEVETNRSSSSSCILFSPNASIFRFSKSSTVDRVAEQGIFIAQDQQAVKRAASYCQSFNINNTLFNASYNELAHQISAENVMVHKEEQPELNQKLKLDGTGAYHWSEPCTLEDVTMTELEAATLTDHIVVCVVGDKYSPSVGLRNLLFPLRSSNLPLTEVKKVLLLGKKRYIEKEWKHLNDFPEVYFMEGSPMKREDVLSAGVQRCLMCVILSSVVQTEDTDSNLVDKEIILSFYQIKGCGRSGNVFNHSRLKNRAHIPVVSEIVNNSNVQFMEKPMNPSQRKLEMALPFIRGEAFIVSVLDAILSLAFYNKKLIRIIQKLITGMDCYSQYPENTDIDGCGSSVGLLKFQPWLRTRMACRITQISLSEERFSRMRDNKYGELFKMMLNQYNMLALGLYRCHDKPATQSNMQSTTFSGEKYEKDRYVITAPPYHLKLRHNDKVFVLAQSENHIDQTTPCPTRSAATHESSSRPSCTIVNIDGFSPG